MRPLAGLTVAVGDAHPAAEWAARVLAWLGADVGGWAVRNRADIVLGGPEPTGGRLAGVRLVADLPEDGGFGTTPGGIPEATALAGLQAVAAVCLGAWAAGESGGAGPVAVDVSLYRAALGLVQPTLAGAPPPRLRPWLAYRAGKDGLLGLFCVTPRDLEDLRAWAALPPYPAAVRDGDRRAAEWAAQLDAWVARWPVERLAAEAQAWRLPWAAVRPPPCRPMPPWRVRGEGPGPARLPGGEAGAPLAGLRVVDLTALWAGPQVTRWLRALGARVVKVESPLRPDGFRAAGGPVFRSLNAGKAVRSLHLGRPGDDRAFARLLAAAHVLVDNLSPRVLPQLGWDDAALWRVRPGLVHVSMPAFGGEGPERYWVGYGPTMEAASGVAWRAGVRRGEPVGLTVGDPLAAGWGLVAVLAALLEARRTGRGAAVEMSQVRALGALAAAGLTGRGLAGSGWEDPEVARFRRGVAVQRGALDAVTAAVRAPWAIRRGRARAAGSLRMVRA